MAYTEDNHTYKMVKIVGTSRAGVDDAIRSGIARAEESLRNLRWFEVKELRGWIQDGRVQHFQAIMEVGFTMEDVAE